MSKMPTPKGDQLRAMRERNYLESQRDRPTRAELEKAVEGATARNAAAQERRAARKASKKGKRS